MNGNDRDETSSIRRQRVCCPSVLRNPLIRDARTRNVGWGHQVWLVAQLVAMS